MIPFIRAFTAASICMALSLITLVATPAFADTDYTDHWSNPTQNGWGVAMTQGANVIYVEIFHYNADHSPTWFGGTVTRLSDGHYQGALFTVSGDYYGHMPYDPLVFAATPAGTLDFNATDPSHGQLSFTINGVTVLTQVERLTLDTIALPGNYLGAIFQAKSAECSGGASANYSPMQIIVTQPMSDGPVGIEFRFADAPYETFCTTTGAVTQQGRVLDMATGVHVCSGSTYPSLHVYDIRRTASGGIEGRWTTVAGNSCVDSGKFIGMSP